MPPFDLGHIFAVPIQAAVRAQSLASQEIISFIQQFGLEKGTVRNLRFRAERTSDGIDQPIEISIPLLSIVPPPSVQLEEMNVEFAVQIVQTAAAPKARGQSLAESPGAQVLSSLATFSSLQPSSPHTMRINMRIMKQVPEGVARVNSVLADLLSGQSVKNGPATAKKTSIRTT